MVCAPRFSEHTPLTVLQPPIQTMFGKLLCSVAMLFGLLYLAMPIAIVGTNFYKV